MKLFAALLALAASLSLQAALGGWFPRAPRYVDVMLLPVVWYGIAGSQRSAMFMGCAAGLLRDAWFQAGVFGVHGFSRTLLGWALGGLGARFDLNHLAGHFVGGGLLFVGDQLVELGLLLLLGQAVAPLDPIPLGIAAAMNASLAAGVFAVGIRVRGREAPRRAARGRA